MSEKKTAREKFLDRVTRWQKAEPGELAPNFHALIDLDNFDGAEPGTESPNYQFVKASVFPLEGLTELQAVADQIQEIYIWMAMDSFEKDKIGFEPIVQVAYLDTKGITQSLMLFAKDNNNALTETEPIPVPFVDNTTKLWREIASENVPDAFTVMDDLGFVQRVRYYRVEGTGLTTIKKMLPNATSFSILPGLDLNKSVSYNDTTFIPIIRVSVTNLADCALDDLHKDDLMGVHWSVSDDGDGDGFFDFSNPCPPLCYPPPPPPGGND